MTQTKAAPRPPPGREWVVGGYTEDDLREFLRARTSFRSYVKAVHGWEPPPHQDMWFRGLQSLKDGTLMAGEWLNGVALTPKEDRRPTKKLMILAPPGSGKTDTMDEWVAWMVGCITETGVIAQGGLICYGDETAMIRSAAIRDTIPREEYLLVFPNTKPHKGKGWATHSWFVARLDESKKDPTLHAAGITGGILSFRFPHFLLIDDPHDYRNIRSETEKEDVWRTWRNTIRTRVHVDTTPVVLICTRWADDDLAGRLMEVEKDWCIIRTTALVPEEGTDEEQDTYWDSGVSPMGDPVGISKAALLKLREEGPEDFETQYMTRPPSVKGDIFKEISFGHEPPLDDVQAVWQFWDTAMTETKRSAFNVMGEFVKRKSGRAYLRRVKRFKAEMPELLRRVVKYYDEAVEFYGERVKVRVEEKVSGISLCQLLVGQIRIKPQSISKMSLRDRAKYSSLYFDGGQVYLPADWTSWKEEYLRELRGFQGEESRWKDQVAMTCLATEKLFPTRARGRPRPSRILHWVRR